MDTVINNNEFIGISENRLHHILSVARECYSIAKERGHDESFCRKMFVIGWNHDIGYEFSKEHQMHPLMSFNLLLDCFVGEDAVVSKEGLRSLLSIQEHGIEPLIQTEEWIILNSADMTINSKGQKVTPKERLANIKEIYGEVSSQYLKSYKICRKLGLI